MSDWVTVARVGELAPGEGRVVDVEMARRPWYSISRANIMLSKTSAHMILAGLLAARSKVTRSFARATAHVSAYALVRH